MAPRRSAARIRRRSGRGALFLLASLLVGSALLRFADGYGSAFAASDGTAAASEAAGPETAAGLAPVPEVLPPPAAALVPETAPDGAELADLLTLLRDREARVAEREQAVEERARQIELAQRTLSENLAALTAAEESLKATLAVADGAMEADIDRLTKVYETMKPKEAALLFETMDPTFAAGFLARMTPAAAAAVMAGLAPETAYTISILLAGRHHDVPRQ